MVRFTLFTGAIKNGEVVCPCGGNDLEIIYRDLVSDQKEIVYRCRKCKRRIDLKYYVEELHEEKE